MGQQIGHVGYQHFNTVCEHGATAEPDFSYLSSHVEKLMKLARSSLATRYDDRHQISHNVNVQHHFLQDGESIISSPVVPAQDPHPLHFSDISTDALRFNGVDYDMGVANKPLGLYNHAPDREVCKVDGCNTGCRTTDKSSDDTTKASKDYEQIFTQTLCANCKINCRNDQASVSENDALMSEEEASSEIFMTRHESAVDSKLRVCEAERHCRGRPPPSPKLIATPSTVLQSAHEPRPPEIGSYLTVAPVVSSSDLGLSPIDENVEMVPSSKTTPLLSPANTTCDKDGSTIQTTPRSSSYLTSFEARSSDNDSTKLQFLVEDMVHDSDVSNLKNSVASSLDKSTHCTCHLQRTKLSHFGEEYMKRAGSISVEVLRTANDALSDGKLSQDASDSSLSSDFSALASGRGDTDKFLVFGIKNATHVASSGCWALHDEDMVRGEAETKHPLSIRIPYNTAVNHQYHHSLVAAASCPELVYEHHSPCSFRSSTPYSVLTDSVSVGKSRHHDTCFALHETELDMCGMSNSALDSAMTEWDAAVACCDWSANNNASKIPGTVRMNMSPTAASSGPVVARRQVRHSSDSSAPLSSSWLSARERTSNSASQYLPVPSRTSSQLSLDDVIVSPRTVPERLDFQQLEKFEGMYLVVD